MFIWFPNRENLTRIKPNRSVQLCQCQPVGHGRSLFIRSSIYPANSSSISGGKICVRVASIPWRNAKRIPMSSLPFPHPPFQQKPLCTSPLTPIALLQATLFPDLHHYSHPMPFLLAMKQTPSGSHCMVGRPFISSHTSIKPSPASSQLPGHH